MGGIREIEWVKGYYRLFHVPQLSVQKYLKPICRFPVLVWKFILLHLSWSLVLFHLCRQLWWITQSGDPDYTKCSSSGGVGGGIQYWSSSVCKLPNPQCRWWGRWDFDLDANQTNTQRPKEGESTLKEQEERSNNKTKQKNKKNKTLLQAELWRTKGHTISSQLTFYCWGRVQSWQAPEPTSRHVTAVGLSYCLPRGGRYSRFTINQ